MAFMAVEGYKGYVVFVWSYGIFLGGYQYSLKMYIYEKVRARNFARAWGFAQASSSLGILVSVPILSKFSEYDKKSIFFHEIVFLQVLSMLMALTEKVMGSVPLLS